MNEGHKAPSRAMYGCGGDPIDDDTADDFCTVYHCAGDCGMRGHGAQHKGNGDEPSDVKLVSVPLEPLLELLTELHKAEYLSEQQCAKMLGWDLLDWRIATQPAPHPFAQEP